MRNNKKPGPAYRVDVGSASYDYWLEHASTEIDDDDQNRESAMLTEVYSPHAKIRRSEVSDDFEFPAAGRCLRMVAHGELVSAGEFDSYDTSASNLFVKYLVNLPEGWSITKLATDR